MGMAHTHSGRRTEHPQEGHRRVRVSPVGRFWGGLEALVLNRGFRRLLGLI